MEEKTSELNGSIQKIVGFSADFDSDLNAMHEAEKILVHPCEANRGKPDYGTYHDELWKICNRSNVQVMFATARQRAEAFVKTIEGKSVREGG